MLSSKALAVKKARSQRKRIWTGLFGAIGMRETIRNSKKLVESAFEGALDEVKGDDQDTDRKY